VRCFIVLHGSKRDYVRVLSDIVDACSEQRGITYVMMVSSLNYVQVRRYLSDAIKSGLIRVVRDGDDRSKYLATSKGLEFIRGIRELISILDGIVVCGKEGFEDVLRAVSEADAENLCKDGRRGRLELYACILLHALKPTPFTTLCNVCFMNRTVCASVIKELLTAKLLESRGGLSDKRVKALYSTTEKGLCYLRSYIKISTLLKTP